MPTGIHIHLHSFEIVNVQTFLVDVYLLLIIYILKVTEIIIMYNYSKIVQQSIDIFCDRE